MKNKYLLILLTIGTLFSIKVDNVMAQCPVTATASAININCGDSVTLNAIPNGCKPLNNNFNGGTVGTWAATPGGIVVSNTDPTYACMTPSPDPLYYFFMGSTSDVPRDIESNPLDLTACPNVGGSAVWLMKYSYQGQSGTCEGPDAPGEGVYLEYNKGGGWVQIAYYDPNGGNDPKLTTWNQYSVAIPAAAFSAATKFRWIQKACSGSGFDTWAIDNVQIILNIPGYTFDWTHDALAPAATPYTPKVAPSVNTTYTVNYSNTATGGSDACSSTVSVTVATPIVTASVDKAGICPGASANLLAVSSYKEIPPSTCGTSASNTCNSVTSQSNEYTLPTGVSVNTGGNCNENIFGVSNCGGGLRSQILYRASELTALGMKAGKITYLMFEVAQIDAGSSNKVTKGGVTYVRYANLQIKMGCVASTAAVSGSYLAGANTFVYNAKQTDLMVGWNPFTFDNYYDWDGVSNILLDICYALPSGENLVYTKDAATAFASTCTDGTNGAGGSSFSCSAGSPFTSVYSKRANTKFGTCEPKTTVLLNYTWTPSSSLSSSTIYNPVATPAATTTYTVSVAPPGNASCISTSSVSVTVDNLNPAINPNAVTVCPPGTPSAVLTASAAPSAPFNGPITFSSTNNNVAFPDNTPAGINNTINVVGVTPTTLATNPVVKVCTNVTHGNVSQVTAALTSPFGTKIVLYNAAGTGANFTNTCFVTAAPAITTGAAPYTGSFAPNAAFQTTGNVNGNWILNIADNASPFIGNVAGGTLNNWNITFNTTTNSAINYQWINTTTGLSSTTIAAPTASPTATTTYTVKITDALGCTGTTTAVVGYCVAVPINLSNELTATRIGSAVNLIWQTAQEINNAYFDVEKSNDGINFITLTRLNGQGTTSAITNYSYLDAKPNTGINYYRLKQIDFNGDLKYTNIVGIFFSSNYQNLEMNGLSPIPVLDVLNYKLFALYNGEVTVTITDISGKIIHTEKQNAISGMNDFSINVNSLQQGSYILKSIQNGQTDVKRFVK